MSTNSIDSLLHEDRHFPPSPEFAAAAVADPEGYAAAKADRLAAAPTYSYSVKIPGVGNVILGEWEYTLSDAMPPRHDNSPSYPPWTAMFQERDDCRALLRCQC